MARRVGIVGAAVTPFRARWYEKTYYELAQMATADALHDAAISVKDVDGVFYGIYNDIFERTCIPEHPLQGIIGMQNKFGIRITNGGATGAYTMSAAHAYVAAERFDVVLVLGVEKATDCFDFQSMSSTPEVIKTIGWSGDSFFEQKLGWTAADSYAEVVLGYMDAHPGCGAAGPKLVLPNGELDLACRRSFPSPEISFYRMTGLSKFFPRSRLFGRYNVTYLSPDVETEVDSVVGAFMLVRREAIAQVGLLDETFWMYGEDLDWAFAIKQAGWQVRYNPAVAVLHVKRAASRQSRRAQIAFHEAMLYFYDKHYAATTSPALGALVVLGIRLNLAVTRLRERFTHRGQSPAVGTGG